MFSHNSYQNNLETCRKNFRGIRLVLDQTRSRPNTNCILNSILVKGTKQKLQIIHHIDRKGNRVLRCAQFIQKTFTPKNLPREIKIWEVNKSLKKRKRTDPFYFCLSTPIPANGMSDSKTNRVHLKHIGHKRSNYPITVAVFN